MSKAFDKHRVDRKTVVSTAAIGEVAIAAPDLFKDLADSAPRKETVLNFAKRCQAVIEGDLKEKVEGMKAEGELLPIGRAK